MASETEVETASKKEGKEMTRKSSCYNNRKHCEKPRQRPQQPPTTGQQDLRRAGQGGAGGWSRPSHHHKAKSTW